ncbi:ester cyclase [Labrys okinawensis]|uniref:ester cyclase n=1 Tax=Labrys okinawensis TaxID=346911 RepID=UPI0039BC8F9D
MDRARRQIIIGGALLASGIAATKVHAGSGSVADDFAARLSAHDIESFAALFADGYVNHQRSAAAPPPGNLTPKQGTVAFFKARLIGMPDLKVTIEAQVTGDDKTAASFVYTGTHQGPYFGVAPTGKTLRFTSCDIFRVESGKIVEHWGMGDIAGVLAQLKG